MVIMYKQKRKMSSVENSRIPGCFAERMGSFVRMCNNPDHNVPSRYEKIYGFLELPDTPEEKDGFSPASGGKVTWICS